GGRGHARGHVRAQIQGSVRPDARDLPPDVATARGGEAPVVASGSGHHRNRRHVWPQRPFLLLPLVPRTFWRYPRRLSSARERVTSFFRDQPQPGNASSRMTARTPAAVAFLALALTACSGKHDPTPAPSPGAAA